MNAFVAELMAVPNPRAQDRIVCGLLAATPTRLFFDYSRSKLRTAEEGMPKEQARFLHSLLQVMHARLQVMAQEPEAGNTKALLEYLSIYDEGILRFSPLEPVAADLNDAGFTRMFNAKVQPNLSHPRRSLQQRLEKMLLARPALQERVDIGYILPHEKLPGLVLPARVGMITVNGAITSAQACDLDQEEDSLLAQLSKSETIQRSLMAYGQQEAMEVDTMKLVVSYAAGTESAGLVDRLRAEKSDVFEVQSMEEFEQVMGKLEKDGRYKKFSSVVV